MNRLLTTLLAVLPIALVVRPAHAQRVCPNGVTAVGDYGLAAVNVRVLASELDSAGELRLRFGSELEVREIRAGSPADGVLHPGDVIEAVDGALVTTFAGSRRITHPPIDSPVRFTIRRRGQESVVLVTPRESCSTLFGPATGPRRPVQLPPGEYVRAGQGDGWLGVQFACGACPDAADPRQRQPLLMPQPRVLEVAPGSPAARAGVRPGDVLLRVDDDPVPGPLAHLRLGSLRPGWTVRLALLRDGRELTVALTAVRLPGS